MNNCFGSGTIQLENYDLVCVGYRDNEKYLAGLRILKQFESIPLKDAHEVMLTHTSRGVQTMQVVSLTYLKRHILQFNDSLSFERSTFLILHEHQKVVRLKYIRGRISLPTNNQSFPQPTLTQRTRLQTHNLVRNIYTSFQRELYGCDEETIQKQFKQEMDIAISTFMG